MGHPLLGFKCCWLPSRETFCTACPAPWTIAFRNSRASRNSAPVAAQRKHWRVLPPTYRHDLSMRTLSLLPRPSTRQRRHLRQTASKLAWKRSCQTWKPLSDVLEDKKSVRRTSTFSHKARSTRTGQPYFCLQVHYVNRLQSVWPRVNLLIDKTPRPSHFDTVPILYS